MIIPPNEQNASIGKAFHTGITGLLQGLAKGKLEKMKTKSTYEALKGLVGPQQALALAALPPEVQAAYLKKYGNAQKESETEQFLEGIRSGNFGQQPQQNFQQEAFQQQPEQVNQQEAIRNALLGITQQPNIEGAQQRQSQAEQIESPRPRSREYKLAQENENYERALENPNIPASAKALIQQRIQQNEDRIQKTREYRDKTYGKELGEMRDDYLAAREWKDNSDRLKELEEEGLPSASIEAFLKGAGIDIAALRQGSGQEYNKIIAGQIKNAKNFFGGRISNFELESFLNTLPTLLNSPEGRKRVLAQIDRLNNLKIATYKTASQIKKENKGITPDDLFEQVDEKLEGQREKIAKQFKQDLKRKVPEAENRFGVGAAYAGGKALPALGGAGLGALIGSVVPGIGTGIGAAGGAIAPALLDILSKLGRSNQ